MSYKQKLIVNFVLLISLIEGISLAFDVYHSYQIRLDYLQERTTLISSTYAQSLSVSVWNLDQETTQSIAASILNDPNIVRIELHYENNVLPKLILEQSNTIKQQMAGNPSQYISNKIPIYEANSSNIIAHITLDADLQSANDFLKNRASVALIEFLILIGINVILISLIMKWMTQPLNKLEGAMQKLATNQIDINIPFINREDEIGDVARSIQVFQKNSQELTSLQKTMEDKIEQQTHSLREAKEKAESGLKTKTQFLSTMSHEIKTPLNGIMGMAELLKQSELSNEDREYLDIILQSGTNLSHIISEILDYSNIDSIKLEILPFNFKQLLENCINEFNPKANQKSLTIKMDYDEDFGQILAGDPLRIRQILVNLIDNSIKFTHQGHIKITVKAPAEHKQLSQNSLNNYTIVIGIEDTGIGIATKDQQRVFDAFTQLDQSNTRQYGGTGLGLSICQKMVKLMNGIIILDSLIDKGTSIHVYLPLTIENNLHE